MQPRKLHDADLAPFVPDGADVLHAHFPAAQVLVLQNDELREAHARVLTRICAFLGIADFAPIPEAINAFEGTPQRISRPTRALARWLLRRERREYQRR